MGTFFCFWLKEKNSKFLTFINNYNKFSILQEAKKLSISIISIGSKDLKKILLKSICKNSYKEQTWAFSKKKFQKVEFKMF